MMLREDERQFEKGQMRNGLEEKHEGGEKKHLCLAIDYSVSKKKNVKMIKMLVHVDRDELGRFFIFILCQHVVMNLLNK